MNDKLYKALDGLRHFLHDHPEEAEEAANKVRSMGLQGITYEEYVEQLNSCYVPQFVEMPKQESKVHTPIKLNIKK
jgi:dissimilatory sulfite reductase (desulfoviridin) alpha/beta subunit